MAPLFGTVIVHVLLVTATKVRTIILHTVNRSSFNRCSPNRQHPTAQGAPASNERDGGAGAAPLSKSQGEYSTDPQYFQGDMILPGGGSRSGLRNEALLWPQGKVYYTISSTFNQYQVSLIKQAMEHIESNSCIRFIERTNQQHWLDINNRENVCVAIVGRDLWRQPQKLNLGNGCFYNNFGTAAHELLHALGFYHEQSRPDRDDYINIYWQNVTPGLAYAFERQTKQSVTTSNTPYDYNSIMHYESYAFSNNRQPTMLRKDGAKIIRRDVMSKTDIKELNALYKCDAGGVGNGSGNSNNNNSNSGNSKCKDSNFQCQYWAGRNECNANPNYMEANCRKSCGLC